MPWNYRAIMREWPGGKPGLAADLKIALVIVQKWDERGRIPDGYHDEIARLAHQHREPWAKTLAQARETLDVIARRHAGRLVAA